MRLEESKPEFAPAKVHGAGRQYARKACTYLVPTPSRKGFQWKVSALHGLQRLERRAPGSHPVTVVVPALYNVMPAEVLALGWLNEIDSLASIRQRFILAGKQLGWDVFSFHTRHSLDSYFDSAIKAVRETWLYEGTLNPEAMAQTRKRFGAAYDYHRTEPRLVENLLIQSSLLEWLTSRAREKVLQFHVIGTGLLSALVWSGALNIATAIRTAVSLGTAWDARLEAWAVKEVQRTHLSPTEENIGWLRFHRVRQLIEGREEMSLTAESLELPTVDNPQRPFWFSPTGKSDPVWIENRQDIRAALQTLSLESWSPEIPKPLTQDQTSGRVRGWLASPMHPIAAACRWSFYNYLLATPASSLLFLNHIATSVPLISLPPQQNVFAAGTATYRSAAPSETQSVPGH